MGSGLGNHHRLSQLEEDKSEESDNPFEDYLLFDDLLPDQHF